MAPDIHTLSGAYALDAVEPDERTEFEQHLAVCEACAEEVEALRAAAAQIGEGLAVTPPLTLRQRVISEAARTPQLPPLTGPTTGSDTGPAAGPLGTDDLARRRRRFARPLAAAAAVVALVGGGFVVRDAISDPVRVETISANEVFGAPDARVDSIALKGGQVRVGISKELGLVAVDGADMPAPPRGKVYQLWLVNDGVAEPLSVMEDGVTTDVRSIPASGELAVTAEPAGGSESPTGPVVVQVDPQDI